MKNTHSHRKDEHISLAEKFYTKNSTAGFQNLALKSTALVHGDVEKVNLSTSLAGVKQPFPFFIQAMTGGSEYTGKLNQRLALIAKETGLSMAVGSESVAVKYPEVIDSFKIVRETNPDGFLLANIGTNATPQQAQTAIDLINANALQIHINAAQELVMPEGDRNFDYLNAIKNIMDYVSVPVIVKAVGNGISESDAKQLASIGVRYLDIGGRGGTNFVQIENQRRHHKDFSFMQDLGLTTVQALQEINKDDFSITATGGIKNSGDIIKSIALGADNVGIAGWFLHELLHHSDDEMIDLIENIKYQLRAQLMLMGLDDINQLDQSYLIKKDD